MSSEFPHRLLNWSIHTTHAVWIVALVVSIDKSGAITGHSLFVPPLIAACCLEILRWTLLGRKLVKIKGAYSLASEIETTNRQFQQFSWYLVPVIPPRRLLERYSEGNHDFSATISKSAIYAKFILSSELTKPLLAMVTFFIFVIYSNSPPSFLRGGAYQPFVILYWMMVIGCAAKGISMFVFSVFVRISKGA